MKRRSSERVHLLLTVCDFLNAAMPSKLPSTLSAPALVLVTGANGFIASHVVSQLLAAGYHVLGTVRSAAKIGTVLKVHNHHRKLQLCIVEDITSKEEYVSAIESVIDSHLDAIIHLAAPFSYSVTDYEKDLLIPAVRGTETVLDIAQHFKIKTFVHTNSFACIYDAAAGAAPGKTYTSADWSPLAYEDGIHAPNAPAAYRAAKTVAEQSAWAYIEQCTTGSSFSLISLCPAMVFGPFLPGAEPCSVAELNESSKIVWDVIRQGENGNIPPTKAPVWVDVRDVAEAHVRALSDEALVGKRLLLAAGVYCNQEIADVAREMCPKHKSRIPCGMPGKREAASHFKVDTRAEEGILGTRWMSLRDSLSDIVPQLFEIEQKGMP